MHACYWIAVTIMLDETWSVTRGVPKVSVALSLVSGFGSLCVCVCGLAWAWAVKVLIDYMI